MRALIRSTLVALLLCVSTPVGAGPFEDAQAAYQANDYATALRLWRLLADHGNAEAQIKLAAMYRKGEGVPNA